MRWNWQQPDWRRFQYDPAALRGREDRFLRDAGRWQGTFEYLAESEQIELRVEMMSTEATQTSYIEGELLDRDSVQVSIRRLLGLSTDGRRVGPAEHGIAEMMVDLYQDYARPLAHKQLFRWHHMLTHGRRDLQQIGAYRKHSDPMQIVSGPLARPVVHFEAPPSAQVPEEMDMFLDWLHGSRPDQKGTLPGITRAGLAHLYFESIHPFEDGNGRIGRAISERILSQAVGHPSLIMLADTMQRHRKAYYAALGQASLSNEVSAWLDWFADRVLEAQANTLVQLDFVLLKTRLLSQLQEHLNTRQEKALLRLFRAGPEGFTGGLSARNYQRITGSSPATATRDLADLTEKGALVKQGERKYTRYFLNLAFGKA